ncbi:hypothetical protein OIV83_002242 [Microbotryomycetes sp. JL201]|nr:hypothetical protein OIV83_002242 [Microbotryomycetes sp. JL201]
MGVSATLVNRFKSEFPTGDLGGVTRQILFAHTFNTLFLLISIVGQYVAPNHALFKPFVSFVVVFLGFLQTLVGAGTLHTSLNKNSGDPKHTLFVATEGLTWASAWVEFFAVLVVFVQMFKANSAESKAAKHKQLPEDVEQPRMTQAAH